MEMAAVMLSASAAGGSWHLAPPEIAAAPPEASQASAHGSISVAS